MSQFDDDDDFEDGVDGSINSIRKALRAAEKRAKALETELSSFRSESRKRALQGAIEAKGLNPKIAAFVPADLAADDVATWLDEYGDVFAPAGATAPPSPSDEPTGVVPPEGANIFSEVASSGAAPTGDEGQMLALIRGAKTKAELDTLIFGQPL